MAVTRIPFPTGRRIESRTTAWTSAWRRRTASWRFTVNCLEEKGIFTVRDLLSRTPQQLLEIPNFGEKTLETIDQALAKIGFHRTARPDERPAPKGFVLLRK